MIFEMGANKLTLGKFSATDCKQLKDRKEIELSRHFMRLLSPQHFVQDDLSTRTKFLIMFAKLKRKPRSRVRFQVKKHIFSVF